MPEDVETFLFHFHVSPVEIAAAARLPCATLVCFEFTSSRFPPFFYSRESMSDGHLCEDIPEVRGERCKVWGGPL